MAESTSHVFVVRGRIEHIACDAWLLPTDERAELTKSWQRVLDDLDERLGRSELETLRSGAALVAELAGSDTRPTPILTVGPMEKLRSPEELRPAVRQFLERGAEVAARKREAGLGTAEYRPVPLLAMPFFGSRGGGGSLTQGSLLTTLLDEASRTGRRLGVDVVLVLAHEPVHALAQHVRRTGSDAWAELGPEVFAEAERLAVEAIAGRLVPFMGAGVSITAGAPGWRDLIARLADRASLTPEERASVLRDSRDARDQAAFLREAFLRTPVNDDDDDGGFASAIIDEVRVTRYGLAPALLASLRAEQAITLNYDQLFERAADDAGLPRTVIPGDGQPGSRWLLKLHGTITDRSTIVLTRDDYLGFHVERAAYTALVTATMMTRHLLFVGFGLADDHFHEIVHDVRRTAGETATGPIGTVLTLHQDPLEMTIWRDDFRFVRAYTGDEDSKWSARALEIFLDAVMALASDRHSYLLAEGFEDGLDESELELRRQLLAFAEGVRRGARETSSWPHVEYALKELGLGHRAD